VRLKRTLYDGFCDNFCLSHANNKTWNEVQQQTHKINKFIFFIKNFMLPTNSSEKEELSDVAKKVRLKRKKINERELLRNIS
jgi:hypothetical protein